jgi:nucleoside-diphosphate-sugar epimerase
MRVLVIGATGTIGSAVVKLLSLRHEVVKIGHQRGEHQVDLAHTASIRALYETVGAFDAVVSTAGLAKFGGLDELSDADYLVGLRNKLMGQVNVVLIGRGFIRDRGSFTVTSGVLSHEPMKGSASISMVNAGQPALGDRNAQESGHGPRHRHAGRGDRAFVRSER